MAGRVAEVDSLLFADARRPEVAPLVAMTPAQMRVAFTDPGVLEVDSTAFSAACRAWIAEPQHRAPDGDLPEWLQMASRLPTLTWIEAQRTVRYNCVWRNRKGFRRHYLNVEAPTGLLVGKIPARRRSPTRWLMNIPKVIRKVGLRAPEGRLLIQGDIKSAFPTFMCRAAQDAVLFQDLHGDFHGTVAAALGIPRDAAKIVNNGLVGLMGPRELHTQFTKASLQVTPVQAAAWHAAWWGRYVASRCVVETLRARWGQATSRNGAGVQGLRSMTITAPDGQVIRYSRAEVAGARLPNGVTRGFPSMVSAIWQCIEATAQDLAILDLHRHRDRIGLRFVLGMYDGLIYSAPEQHAAEAEALVRRAMLDATARIGYGARVTTAVDRYWT